MVQSADMMVVVMTMGRQDGHGEGCSILPTVKPDTGVFIAKSKSDKYEIIFGWCVRNTCIECLLPARLGHTGRSKHKNGQSASSQHHP